MAMALTILLENLPLFFRKSRDCAGLSHGLLPTTIDEVDVTPIPAIWK